MLWYSPSTKKVAQLTIGRLIKTRVGWFWTTLELIQLSFETIPATSPRFLTTLLNLLFCAGIFWLWVGAVVFGFSVAVNNSCESPIKSSTCSALTKDEDDGTDCGCEGRAKGRQLARRCQDAWEGEGFCWVGVHRMHDILMWNTFREVKMVDGW